MDISQNPLVHKVGMVLEIKSVACNTVKVDFILDVIKISLW